MGATSAQLLRYLLDAMEEDADEERGKCRRPNEEGAESHEIHEPHAVAPATCIGVLIDSFCQYQDVYPVLLRGVEALSRELHSPTVCCREAKLSGACYAASFVTTGALNNLVGAMIANLDKTEFTGPCLELLSTLLGHAGDAMAAALLRADIVSILEKVVHNVIYLDEPACIHHCAQILLGLAVHSHSVSLDSWRQMVATAAQAMLANVQSSSLALECVLSLDQIFRIGVDFAIPIAAANIILKKLDQWNQRSTGLGEAFFAAEVSVIFRVMEITPGEVWSSRSVFATSVLAGALHHYQTHRMLGEMHKEFVEKLVKMPLGDVVRSCLERLRVCCSLGSEEDMSLLHTAAVKLELVVIWREEARDFLAAGGVAVIAQAFASRVMMGSPATEASMAASMYRVSIKWTDELWNEMRVDPRNLNIWVEELAARHAEHHDKSVSCILSMMNSMLQCEGFRELLAESNGITMLGSVFRERQLLPDSARKAIAILASTIGANSTAIPPDLPDLITEAMNEYGGHDSVQFDCAKALGLLCSLQGSSDAFLSDQNTRTVVRVMSSNLRDCAFVAEMLHVVANILTNDSARVLLSEQGALWIVSKAVFIHSWGATDRAGVDAHAIICEVAHKLDVVKTLSILESQGRCSDGLSLQSEHISIDALEECCYVVGALASVKTLLPDLIAGNVILYLVGIQNKLKRDSALRADDRFVRISSACFYALQRIANTPGLMLLPEQQYGSDTDKGVDSRDAQARMIDCGAFDVIIDCLEEAVGFATWPSVLVHHTCQLLHSILELAIPLTMDAQDRWLSVAVLILRKDATQRQTIESVFSLILAVLARGERSVKVNQNRVDILQEVLKRLDSSLQGARQCTLSPVECIAAVRVVETIVAASGVLADLFVSRCLGLLGKLMRALVFSTSSISHASLAQCERAISLLACHDYLNKLASRLENAVTVLETSDFQLETDDVLPVVEDFRALTALLFSNQAKKLLSGIAYHRICIRLAVIDDHIDESMVATGLGAEFFSELGCLASRLLPVSQREQIVNASLCHFAESNVWHSMRWVVIATDRNSSDMMLITEFVLLRLISGYYVYDQALLVELLQTLTILLLRGECSDIVEASPHAQDLPGVLWEIVREELRRPGADVSGDHLAAAVLETIAVLFSARHGELLPIDPNKHDGEDCVQFCLHSLSRGLSGSDSSLSAYVTIQSLLQSTRTILQHCIRLGAEHVRSVIQHPATRRIMELCCDADARDNAVYQRWFLTILTAIVQSHGLLYAEKLLSLLSDSTALLVDLVYVVVKEQHFLHWKQFEDCLGIVRSSTADVDAQINCLEFCTQLRRESKRLVGDQVSMIHSREVRRHVFKSVSKLSVMYGRASIYNPHVVRGCLREIGLSGIALYELFCSASSFGVHEFSTLAMLHLKMARLAVGGGAIEMDIRDESVAALRQMMRPVRISSQALAEYINLVAVLYLPLPVKNAIRSFISASESVLIKAIARLIAGITRSEVLDKSVLNLLSLLQATLVDQWTSSDIDDVLQLLEILAPDNASQSALLESVLALPRGLPHLFELARASSTEELQGDIMSFIFQRKSIIRQKNLRIADLEMSAVLSLIKKTLTISVDSISLGYWRATSGFEMLRCALDVLKSFVRLKHSAQLCSSLGGVEVLYDVLRAPSQRESIVHLGLEICCYLSGHGVNLSNESVASLLKALLAFIDTRMGSLQARLAFLVLELALAVEASALNLALIQRCRTQIVIIASRSSDEAAMLIQNLYIYRQRLSPTPGNLASAVYEVTPGPGHHTQALPRMPLQENEIRDIILTNCQLVVQCTPTQLHGGVRSYVDFQTSEKSETEPLVYARLREAVEQLRLVLDDPDAATDRVFVFDLIPALCEIIVLHTITTPLIHTAIQILAQIAFVSPSSVVAHYRVDVRALMASFSLHHRESLAFATVVSRFSNSIVLDHRRAIEKDLSASMLALQIEIVQYWQNDADVVDQCLLTMCSLLETIRAGYFRQFKCEDMLAVLNTVALQQTMDSSTAWTWLKCVIATITKVDRGISGAVREIARVAVGIIQKHTSHRFVVGKALGLLAYIYRKKTYLALEDLVALDGVEMLLTCIKTHANDDVIASTCLEILVATALTPSSSEEANVRLVKEAAATPLLAVCRKQLGNALVCRICLEVVYQMITSFELGHLENKQLRVVAPSGDSLISPEKAELLSKLLEAGSVSLLFDVLGSYASHCGDRLLEAILRLLSELTQVDQGRKLVEACHGLIKLQHTITRLWEAQGDPAIVELGIDCLVNLACSDRDLNRGWKELSMWLLNLAESIQVSNPTGMCAEKIIGILGRLAVDSKVCKLVAQSGAFSLSQLLTHVREDKFLERAIYGLLSMLCEDGTNALSLMLFDIIPITAERISCLVGDEETLMHSLSFFSLLVSNSGEGYLAFQDECVFDTLEFVVQKYPVATATQVNRIASSLLERVSALEYQSSRAKPVHAIRSLNSGTSRGGADKSFENLLRKGATFCVRWGHQQGNEENIDIKLAISADYLLFRRRNSSVLPRMERVFVSQLRVCPQLSLTEQPKTEVALPKRLSKRAFSWTTKRDCFEGDRVLHLKIREEGVLMKASSIRERVYWEQALQWLVARRDGSISSKSSP